MKYFLLLLFVLGCTLYPNENRLEAQLVSGRVSSPDENLTVTVSPQYPRPFETVGVSIDTYWFDLNTAKITWLVNGKVVDTGVGKKSISLTLGDIGQGTSVVIQVEKPYGATFSNTVRIYPSSVELVWEAQTYTPPFYKGKALPTFGSNITVSALPRISTGGTFVPKENLLYTWKLNGSSAPIESGLGKYSISFPATITRKEEVVSVSASIPNTGVEALGETTIKLSNPVIRIYEDHPLYGTLSQTALSQSIRLLSQEISFKAVPFFFSNKDPQFSELEFNWNMNGKNITDTTSDTIVLRSSGEEAGRSTVSVEINNSEKTSQFGETSFTLNFGNNE